MSKGSRQRPKSISDKELKKEWDRIFNKPRLNTNKAKSFHELGLIDQLKKGQFNA